ncbi:MAG: hypothetical protein JKX78_02940 [Alteromonadaceae bacterium]|nr:hypothetical protein [Alteromonadaceae bacterium]
MNTNRSDKLGSTKALKLFGSRRGLAPYQAVQETRAHQKLVSMMVAPNEKVAAAFNRVAKAAKGAVMDFHEFAKFLNHGPIQADLSLQDHLSQPTTGYFKFWFYDPGSPGVSVQDLTDLAQQYAYLHPTKEQAKRRYHEKYPRFFANK